MLSNMRLSAKQNSTRPFLHLLLPVPSLLYMLSSAPAQGKQTTLRVFVLDPVDPSTDPWPCSSLFWMLNLSRLGNQAEIMSLAIFLLLKSSSWLFNRGGDYHPHFSVLNTLCDEARPRSHFFYISSFFDSRLVPTHIFFLFYNRLELIHSV